MAIADCVVRGLAVELMAGKPEVAEGNDCINFNVQRFFASYPKVRALIDIYLQVIK